MKPLHQLLLGAALSGMIAAPALATPFTTTSPVGGALPGTVSAIGGIVIDLVGLNSTRVVAQLSASSLFVGYSDSGSPTAYRGNPLTIGIQTGFSTALVTALGGGLSAAAVRFTLADGDSAPGDFDENDNTLLINGTTMGNWSAVATEQTDSTGTTVLSAGTGFGNNILSTGWFSITGASELTALYAAIGTGSLTYQVSDKDPTDNFYDFTQGVAGGLIDVNVPPTTAAVPEPLSLALFGLGLAGIGLVQRRRAA